jgi:hypothetical protein
MRRIHRIVLLAGLVALAPALAGCEDFDMDKFDIFGLNQKKKLPGDRKAVFPEGVPGVTQGIPPEFVKGNQPPPDTGQLPPGGANDKANAAGPGSKTAAVEPAEEPKPKPKPKPKLKPKPATAANQPPQFQGQQQPAPWPTQGQPQQPPVQQAPPQGTSGAPWPSATGTDSR